MDEWEQAVPFKETLRGYVQGVVRNRLQYQRLYDANGKFRPEVGTRAVTKQPAAGVFATTEPENATVRKRRVTGNENEENKNPMRMRILFLVLHPERTGAR